MYYTFINIIIYYMYYTNILYTISVNALKFERKKQKY